MMNTLIDISDRLDELTVELYRFTYDTPIPGCFTGYAA